MMMMAATASFRSSAAKKALVLPYVVVSLLSAACVGQRVHVITGDESYEAFLTGAADDEQWALIDFMAPWCGHCKRLNPILDEFAAARPSVRVGKVDATKLKALADAHKVSGYPTLKFRPFSSNKGEFREYKGPRDLRGLQRLDDRLRAPPVARIDVSTTEDADNSMTVEDVLERATTVGSEKDEKDAEPIVAFVGAALSPARLAVFEAVAEDRFHETTFAHLVDGEGGPGDDSPVSFLKRDSVAVVEKGEAPYYYVEEEGVLDAERLKKWVKKHNAPLFAAPLGPSTFRKLGASRLVAAAVVDPNKTESRAFSDSVRAFLRDAGRDARERLGAGELDGVRWAEYVETYGITPADLPTLVVIDLPGDKYWTPRRPLENNKPDDFLRSVLAGTIRPRHKGIRGFPDRAWAYYVDHLWLCNLSFVFAVAFCVAAIYFRPRATIDTVKTD